MNNIQQVGNVRKVLFITGSHPDRFCRNLSIDAANCLTGNRRDCYEIQQCLPSEALAICDLEVLDCILFDWGCSDPNFHGDREALLRELEEKQIPILILVNEADEPSLAAICESDIHGNSRGDREYLIEENLTQDLICFALRQAIAKSQLKQRLNIAETRLHSYEFAEARIEVSDRHFPDVLLPKYERILLATPDWVSLVDRNYVYRIVNQTYLDWLQKPRDEIVGHSVGELVGEEIFQSHIKPLLDRCLAGEVVRCDLPIKHPTSGETVLASVTHTPYRELNGAISGVVVNIRDISDRRRAEADLVQLNQELELRVAERTKALRQSNTSLEEVQAIAKLGSWELNINTRVVRWSPQLFRIFGLDPEQQEIACVDVREYLHPDDSEMIDRLRDRAIQQGLPYETDLRFTRVDGTSGVMFAKGKPVFNVRGEVTGLIGVVMDMSDHKFAEIQLQQQAERQRLLKAITQRVRASLDLQEILLTTVQEIRELLQVSRSLVYRVFANGTRTAIAESVLPDYPSALDNIYHDEFFPEEARAEYQQGKIYSLSDRDTEPVIPYLVEFLKKIGVRAKLVVPIIQEEKLWGLLIAHQCDRPRQWQTWEIDLLQEISNQLAIAIRQAYLYEQLREELRDRQHAEEVIRQQADREVLLKEITQRIRQTLDLPTVFETAAREIRQFLYADRVAIFKFDPQSNFVDGEFVSENVTQGISSVLANRMHDHCFGEQFAEDYRVGKFQAVSDIRNAGLTQCHVDSLAKYQIRANMVMPLLDGSQLWGLICIHQCSSARNWNTRDIDLIQQISIQLAIAIQQANLYQQVQAELASKEKLYVWLSNELHQKSVLLKEVHHRVKNNLQVMSSLLRMQFRKATPELKALVEDYQNRIHSMALIHAQLHQNDDLSYFNAQSAPPLAPKNQALYKWNQSANLIFK
jgi:PAS domain S-box-containing protein